MINRRFGLCAAPILLFLVDISLTLWGQPADYWAGNYAVAREGFRGSSANQQIFETRRS